MSDFENNGSETDNVKTVEEERRGRKRRKAKKKRRSKNKTSIVIVVVLIITTAFTLFLNIDNPVLQDFFSWVGLYAGNHGTIIELDKTEKYDITEHNGNVILARNETVSDIDSRMNVRWSIQQGNSAPVVKTNGKYTLSYSFDVANAILAKDGKELSIATDNPIICASVNKNGYTVLVTREKGYKAQVVVYSPDGGVVYKWHSADNYIVDVDISPDNSTLAVATADFSTDQASGGVMFFNFSQEKPYCGQIFQNNLVLEIQFADRDSLLVVGDISTQIVKSNGDKESEYLYNGKKLKNYDIGTDFSVVFALSQSDSVMDSTELKFVNKKLKEKGSVVATGNVSSIDSVRGKNLIALDRTLYLMNEKGKELKSVEMNKDIKKAVLFGNGKSALVASGSTVELVSVK